LVARDVARNSTKAQPTFESQSKVRFLRAARRLGLIKYRPNVNRCSIKVATNGASFVPIHKASEAFRLTRPTEGKLDERGIDEKSVSKKAKRGRQIVACGNNEKKKCDISQLAMFQTFYFKQNHTKIKYISKSQTFIYKYPRKLVQTC